MNDHWIVTYMKHLDSFHVQISVGEMIVSDIRGNDIGNAKYTYLCSLIVVVCSIHVCANKLHLLIY